MFKRLLAIIGLVFAGLAIWPAWTDGVAGPAPAGDEAAAAPRASAARREPNPWLSAPAICRRPANRPLAHRLLRLFGLACAGGQAGREPGARPGAAKSGPGGATLRAGPDSLP